MATKKQLVDKICSNLEIAQERINSILEDFNCDALEMFHKVNLEILNNVVSNFEGQSYELEDDFNEVDDLEEEIEIEKENRKFNKPRRKK